MSESMSNTWFFVATFAVLPVTIMGALLFMRIFGIRTLSMELEELERIRSVGYRSLALVQSIRETGSSVNDNSVAQVELVLQTPDGASYAASALWIVSAIHAHRVQSGHTVHVAIDPASPQKVALLPF